MKPVYFSQYDAPWNKFPYPSSAHPDATVQSGGCGVVCFAMIHATHTDPNFTPDKSAQLAIMLGDRGAQGTEDEFFEHAAAKYGYGFQNSKDIKVMLQAITDGKLVVCRMANWFRPGAGHFILAWGLTGGKIQIHDPASRANSAKLYDQAVFKEKCIGYFIFSKKEIKPMTYLEAIEILSKTPSGNNKVINSPDSLKKDLQQPKMSTDRVKSLLINMATAVKG